jgi:hypothetical protein
MRRLKALGPYLARGKIRTMLLFLGIVVDTLGLYHLLIHHLLLFIPNVHPHYLLCLNVLSTTQ